MLKPALRDRIKFPEMRLLYDSKIFSTHPIISHEMQKCIRDIRRAISNQDYDQLSLKLKRFGNNGQWMKAKLAELEKVIYENKRAPDEFVGQWRSIEFECIFKSKEVLEGFASFIRSKGLTKLVTIKEDGSVYSSLGRGQNEIEREVVVTYRSGKEDIVRDVCSYLQGKAYSNNTCGTHVHFDMRHVDMKTVRIYGRRLARAVPALKLMIPVERRSSQYCAVTDISETNRYSFINLCSYEKHKTIEVRGHAGTIVADKILNWIKLCEIIMCTTVRSKLDEFKTAKDLVEAFNLDQKMINYINDRMKLFDTSSQVMASIPHGIAMRNNVEDIIEE